MGTLKVVQKHSILGGIVIGCVFVFILIYVVGVATMKETFLTLDSVENPNPSIQSQLLLFHVLILIALNIGPAALYLSFAANTSLYFRCCTYCDARCEVFCNRIATAKLYSEPIRCPDTDQAAESLEQGSPGTASGTLELQQT